MILNYLMAVLSREQLSGLTFPKVFCLQTPLSDFKKKDRCFFTSKIIFHLHKLSTAVSFNNMAVITMR